MSKPNGFMSLALVVGLSVGITVMAMVTLGYVQNASTTSLDLIQKQKSLFAAEGGIRIVQKLAQDYLVNTDQPTSQGMVNYVRANMNDIQPSGFTFSDIQAEIKGSGSSVIPSGPFMGMSADVNTVQFTLTAKNQSGSIASTVNQETVLGSIRLFQFFMFSDQNVEWNNGPPQTVHGRVHINSDICFGGTGGYLSMDYLTSAGRIMLTSNPGCYIYESSPKAQISNGTSYRIVKNHADHGCTNCDNSGQAWKTYALNTWNGRVQDIDHKVPALRLPGTGETTTAQKGRDVVGNLVSNNGSMRILVDPVVPTDSVDDRANKFSAQADIRIINGVWFLRDPQNDSNWPGIPIWSDHPGQFTSSNEESIEGTMNVGQDDLRASRGWVNTPKRFSLYEYNTVNDTLTGDEFGVVSYGNLMRDASGGSVTWRPGHWVRSGISGQLCPNTYTCTNCANGLIDTQTQLTCSNGVDTITLERASGILNGTRGGFLNGHIKQAIGGSAGLAHQLPLNFDVEQFQVALQDQSDGELGSYFGSGRFMGRDFNGIIYISNTWSGSLRGMDGADAPTNWPIQGTQVDANQPPTGYWAPARVQAALPYPLCSTSEINQFFAGPNGRFRVPDCASYQGTTPAINSRPNVVRVFNGRNLSPAALPKGLTIATNLPIYILGDYNTSSDPSTLTSEPWVPALVAGDFVGHLSNNWDDANSRWNSPYVARVATTTTYNTSMLAGYMIRTAKSGGSNVSGGGLNTFTRYNENWDGVRHNINGSLVVGFTSVYFHYANECCSVETYSAPNRFWNYDPHLYNNKKQPPGTPSFYVYAVKDWYSSEAK